MRFAAFSQVALLSAVALAGCEEGAGFALTGAGAAPDDYPVRKAACVGAVRRETRNVDVRAQTAEVIGGDTPETAAVVFGLEVGQDAAPWTCTADNAGAVTDVGPAPVPVPEPVAEEAPEAEAETGR